MNHETVKTCRLNEQHDVTKVAQLMPENPLELKLKINKLLWEELPAQTTLDEAEKVRAEMTAALGRAERSPSGRAKRLLAGLWQVRLWQEPTGRAIPACRCASPSCSAH